MNASTEKPRHVAYRFVWHSEDGSIKEEERGFIANVPAGVSTDRAIEALADRLSRQRLDGRRPSISYYQTADTMVDAMILSARLP